MTAFHHRSFRLGQLTHLCVFDMRPPPVRIMIPSFIELATDAPMMTERPAIPDLPLRHFRLEWLPQGDFPSHYYLGSAWRGALGYALKANHPDLFEQLYVKGEESGQQPPLVLSPLTQGNEEEGYQFTLDVILAGSISERPVEVLESLIQAGLSGLYGTPFSAITLQAFLPQTGWFPTALDVCAQVPCFGIESAPPAPATVAIHLLHPLRIKGPRGILHPQDFKTEELLTRILRRYHNLRYDYRGVGLPDWAGSKAAALSLTTRDQALNWHDWSRYSHRQEQSIPMGGLLGHIVLEGQGLEAVWPHLWAGQWLHVGKGAMMGLGQYALEALD